MVGKKRGKSIIKKFYDILAYEETSRKILKPRSTRAEGDLRL